MTFFRLAVFALVASQSGAGRVGNDMKHFAEDSSDVHVQSLADAAHAKPVRRFPSPGNAATSLAEGPPQQHARHHVSPTVDGELAKHDEVAEVSGRFRDSGSPSGRLHDSGPKQETAVVQQTTAQPETAVVQQTTAQPEDNGPKRGSESDKTFVNNFLKVACETPGGPDGELCEKVVKPQETAVVQQTTAQPAEPEMQKKTTQQEKKFRLNPDTWDDATAKKWKANGKVDCETNHRSKCGPMGNGPSDGTSVTCRLGRRCYGGADGGKCRFSSTFGVREYKIKDFNDNKNGGCSR